MNSLIHFTTNLSDLVEEVRSIRKELSHLNRILEHVYPMQTAEANWNHKPAEEFHIADDKTIFDREDEENRRNQNFHPVSELGDESVPAGYDPADL